MGKNNQLIQRSIKKSLLPNFMGSFVTTFSYMVDMILAAQFFSAEHIACIGISAPFLSILFHSCGMISDGGGVAMNVYVGRGDREKGNQIISAGMIVGVIIGIVALTFTCTFANPILHMMGAREADMIQIAKPYMISRAFAFITLPMDLTCMYALKNLGYHKERFIGMMVSLITNVVFSLLLIKYTSLGIAGLGLGTLLSEICTIGCYLFFLKKRKTEFQIRFCKFTWSDIVELFKFGFPTTGDAIAENIANGIINNLLVIYLGVISVAVYSIARSIYKVFSCAMNGVQQAATPIISLLFGARDRNGLKKLFRSTFMIGTISTIVWGVIVLIAMPFLLNLYGAGKKGIDPVIVKNGVYIMMAFFPIVYLNRLLTGVYQGTGQFVESVLNSVTADSILFPLLLFLLLPVLGYTGVWISYGLSYVTFYILFLLGMSIRKKHLIYRTADIMNLPADIMDNIPKFDISINSTDDVITGLSQKVEKFLLEHKYSGKKAYVCALCLEELAVDLAANAMEKTLNRVPEHPLMDIKVFADAEKVSINIRCEGRQYNPLDFVPNDETFAKVGVQVAQKEADEINYNYMYKMNVVDIVI